MKYQKKKKKVVQKSIVTALTATNLVNNLHANTKPFLVGLDFIKCYYFYFICNNSC